MIEEWEGCHQWAMMNTRRADARVTDTRGVCKIVNWANQIATLAH